MWSESSLLLRRHCSFLALEHSIRCAGAGGGADVVDVDRLVAFATGHDGVHVVVTGRVVQDEGGALWAGEPAVAPCGHRGQDGKCVAALVGEAILVTDRVLLVLDATQYTLFDESGEAPREHVAPDSELALELLEAPCAEAGLADQQQVPMVAEHRSTTRNCAWPIGGVDTLHTPSLRPRVA
jgi:hypothetical protein